MTAREFVCWWLGHFDDVRAVGTFYSFSKSIYGLDRQHGLKDYAREGLRAYTKMNKTKRCALVKQEWRKSYQLQFSRAYFD